MTVIQRRVFYGKVGTADQLVEVAREMYSEIVGSTGVHGYRIMTDHQSGRTDRLAVEIEVDSLGDMESAIEKTMNDPSLQKMFEALFGRLAELIDHAEVEQWLVH